jgi:hypothetical protein
MSRVRFYWISEPEPKRHRLKPWLLLGLTLAVLGYCAVIGWR